MVGMMELMTFADLLPAMSADEQKAFIVDGIHPDMATIIRLRRIIDERNKETNAVFARAYNKMNHGNPTND